MCLAGGVALNCVANGKLLKEKIFDDIWIQPASGDAGSSLGAAMVCWHEFFKNPRKSRDEDLMKGAYLGCCYSNEEIANDLNKINASFLYLEDTKLFAECANLINKGNVIGWFSGPMEFGPRALGGRSIIGDPRNSKMQSIMNLKIKYRESFRPFAPSVLEEDISNQFETSFKSPYMLIVSEINKKLRKKISKPEEKLFGIQKLNLQRSSLPAITHVDYSARIQSVSKKTNLRYYNLISAFKKLTGCPTIINTSFNVRGEPIVRTPLEAYKCFMRTEMDVLVLQNYILFKKDQKNIGMDNLWQKEFELD